MTSPHPPDSISALGLAASFFRPGYRADDKEIRVRQVSPRKALSARAAGHERAGLVANGTGRKEARTLDLNFPVAATLSIETR